MPTDRRSSGTAPLTGGRSRERGRGSGRGAAGGGRQHEKWRAVAGQSAGAKIMGKMSIIVMKHKPSAGDMSLSRMIRPINLQRTKSAMKSRTHNSCSIQGWICQEKVVILILIVPEGERFHLGNRYHNPKSPKISHHERCLDG